MGQYCELYISDYPIATSKNEIDPFILSLFQPEDLKSFTRKISERNQLLYGRGDTDDEEYEKAVEYSNTSKSIKDRLEIMGFTLKKVKAEFQIDKQESVDSLKYYIKNKTFGDSEDIYKRLEIEAKLLESSSFEDFLQASKEIIDNKYRYKVKVEELPKETNSLILYLLEYDNGLDRFPYNHDLRVLLRALLEITPNDSKITYDITELIDSEREDDIEEIYEDTIQNITYDYELGEKFLILTEGSTDIQILQDAMNVLYPHLRGYYSFMDFGISNAAGSTSSLVASVKSFVGAGIKNRVIALFDNDTAAESAIRGLNKTLIPGNIKILKYPDIKLAEDYPTLGPTGISNMNVNGLACSIELYLGKDILQNDNGYIPIQWKGYDQAVGKYQGEVTDKLTIQKKFQIKVGECLQDRNKIVSDNWVELEKLLKTVFNAFNDNKDEIE